MAEILKPRVVAVIPARFASTRFPAKIIAPLMGHPLVFHTCQRALEARLVDKVLVATDHEAVVAALAPYDIEVVLTRADHESGTDRIAEVARNLDADIVVNVQGDEPIVDSGTIDQCIEALLKDPSIQMATARRRITDPAMIADPNVVKVVSTPLGQALYFSRLPIPYLRDGSDQAHECDYWQHIGLYAYRRDFLLHYSHLPQTPLEKAEKLEQLRVLEHGHPIAVVTTDYVAVGVDVPADLARVTALMQQRAAEG